MGLKLNEIEDIFNHLAIGNASRLWTLEVRKETEKTPAEGARERDKSVVICGRIYSFPAIH